MVLADIPTVGYYVGILFFVITAVLLFIGVIGFVIEVKEPDRTYSRFPVVGLSFIGIGIVVGIVTLFAMWPLKYDYHHWVSKRGVVTDTASRIIPAGEKSVQQRIVLVINGQPYGVDDTRAALVRKGDTVGVKCKKEHQFFQPYQDDGWKCRWGA